ncbi:MAG: NUDIX domain-containing protein [Acidobacteria bacterium]|nr:NUDIX domain-containing protein [Acidobacteriota bacterium]
MWHKFFSRIWRRLPKRVRRWGVVLLHPRFTVTAGAVVVDAQGRVLLLHHRFRAGSGWGIPGGFLSPRESPEEALRRELREEVGLELDNVTIAFIHTLQAYQQIEIVFRCSPRNTPQICSAEISRAEWFALDALPAEVSEYQRWLLHKALTPELHGASNPGEHET